MKLLDIAAKDLRQGFRSFFALMFMFVVPLLVTGLFYLMFGGVGDDEGFSLPQTTVVIANLDAGRLPDGMLENTGLGLPLDGASTSASEPMSMGDILVQILSGETFADLMQVSNLNSAEAARQAVDNQEAGVAVIIPEPFTDALTGPGSGATVQFYRDPTLTFGPQIVESIVRQILDAFVSGQIGVQVSMEQLVEAGVSPTPEMIQGLLAEFTAASAADPGDLVALRQPAGEAQEVSLLTQIIGTIMGGMMVFFAFFTGSASMESILREEERGTLSRLFTTPTPVRTILSGKALAVVLTLCVQVAVLLLVGRFVFGIPWGDPIPVVLAALGIIVISTATGLFLVSLLQNTRQSGIIFGGVLTLTGMLGLIPVFTAGVPNQPPALDTVSLLVPQGWAVRGLNTAMNNGSPADLLPVLGVLLAWSLVFAVIGQRRLQQRFA